MTIPLSIMAQHVAVVGRTGSGKTFAAKGLVERLLAEGRRVVVLDPVGAWWGLRLKAEGKESSGFRVAIIGGEHGDVPLAVENAEALAGWLVTTGASAVIDLSDMLIGERHRFVTEFAATLHSQNRAPLHLVIDEADEFAPQNPLPETRRMLGQIDRIVRRGRIRGFRVTLITQRPAVLHKNVLTQVNTLIAMRLMAPQDRKAIEAWIEGQGDAKAGRDVLASLASLKTGEGWIWSPDLDLLRRQRFPAITTYDSSRSPDDSDAGADPVVAPLDFADLRALLAAPEPEPIGPGVLAAPTPETVKALCREQYERGYRDAMIEQRQRLHQIMTHVVSGLETARIVLGDDPETPEPIIDGAGLGFTIPRRPRDEPGTAATALPLPPLTSIDEARAIALSTIRPAITPGDGKRRILVALAQFREGLGQQRLALIANLVRGSGTWTKYLGALRSAGYVEGKDTLRITAAGLKAVGDYEPLPTGEALRRHWATWLGGGGERRIFEVLLAAYPKAMSTHQVAARSNLVLGSGTWTKYLGRLRSLQLVRGRGELRAADELFQ